MIRCNEVQAQLVKLEGHYRFIGITELNQLARALEPGEQILDCLKGWHEGKIAVLCVTDQRMLIVDKNTTRSRVQAINYTGIEDITHIDKGWSSVLLVQVPGKVYQFLSWHIKRMKTLQGFIKRHMDYVKEQAEGAQQLVDKIRFQTTIRPKESTSRNWAVFAKRIGNSSLS